VTVLLPLLAFLFASLLVGGAALALSSGSAAAIERRLVEVAGEMRTFGTEPAREPAFVRAMKRIGQIAPKSPSEMGKLRLRLVAAGYRGHEAIIVLYGIRIALAAACFALLTVPVLFRPNLPAALVGAAVATSCRHPGRPHGEAAPAPDSPRPARRPRSAGGQR
jgi:hypothetical protein